MSFLGGGSSGGGQTTAQSVQPYSAAEPALGQILSEATNLYGQGVGAAGYVPPTQQTLTGLAQQETMANAANQQLAATLGGQYLNPFLSTQVAQAALPLAFQEYGIERGRQLGIAQRTPTLLQTGQQLEALQRQQQLAPAQALQQYSSFVSPIAAGFPTTQGTQAVQASPVSTALGGALIGSQVGGLPGAVVGGFGGLLGGLL